MTRRGKQKLWAERRAKFIEYIRANIRKTTAAKAAGLSVDQVNSWLKQGWASKRSQYHQFANDYEKATSEAETYLILKIRAACEDPQKGPDHCKWLLTHHPSYAKHWNPTSKQEVTSRGSVTVDLETMTDEQLQAIASGNLASIEGESGAGEAPPKKKRKA